MIKFRSVDSISPSSVRTAPLDTIIGLAGFGEKPDYDSGATRYMCRGGDSPPVSAQPPTRRPCIARDLNKEEMLIC
jgi:hypothetical protein